jgi:short subunit dehydrogenase-like uncharacterized protein
LNPCPFSSSLYHVILTITDCIPWDLSVLACSEHLRSRGDTLSRVQCFDEIIAHASGGTMATVFNSLSNRQIYKAKLGFDPLLKTSDGQKSNSQFSVRNRSMIGFEADADSWAGPFVMAAVMVRSHRLFVF